MGLIPKRWDTYTKFGTLISDSNLIPFKTPLSHELFAKSNYQEAFYVEELFDVEEIGLVINLVSHHIRYDEEYIKNRNVDYVKLTVKGGGAIPTEEEFENFVNVINNFQSKSDKAIGVHCSHGVNRTGYFVARFLIEQRGFEPEAAIDIFSKSRGHPIDHKALTDDLMNRKKS